MAEKEQGKGLEIGTRRLRDAFIAVQNTLNSLGINVEPSEIRKAINQIAPTDEDLERIISQPGEVLGSLLEQSSQPSQLSPTPSSQRTSPTLHPPVPHSSTPPSSPEQGSSRDHEGPTTGGSGGSGWNRKEY